MCDSKDFYPSGSYSRHLLLQKIRLREGVQSIGLFRNESYLEALGGYGGISHCPNLHRRTSLWIEIRRGVG
jgi:arginine decarboxylase